MVLIYTIGSYANENILFKPYDLTNNITFVKWHNLISDLRRGRFHSEVCPRLRSPEMPDVERIVRGREHVAGSDGHEQRLDVDLEIYKIDHFSSIVYL